MAKVNLDTAARLDIVCRKGDSFSLTVEFDTEVPNPTDANITWEMEVRTTDSDTGTAHEDGFSFARDSSNTKKLTISNTASNMNISSGLFVYDLQVSNSDDSTVKTYLYGTFQINEDVTVN